MDPEIIYKKLSLCLRSNNHVTKRDIMKVNNIKDNPISNIILEKYTEDNVVDLERLITDLNSFVNKDKIRNKLHFLFKIYDKDNDGMISNYELFDIIDTLCADGLEKIKIQNLVDQTFKRYGTIDFETFYQIIMKKTKNIESYFITQ